MKSFSVEVKKLKSTEGGLNTMCEIMEKYLDQAKKETKKETELNIYTDLVKDGILSLEKASEKSGLSIDTLKEALSK